MPQFTILLPTHNLADILRFALLSILRQTRQDFEVLVVGDGCTDHSAAVVAGLDDVRLRWFDFPKGPGFGYAHRNVSLKEARGRYIAFLGHDNLYFPDHLERLGCRLDETGADIVYSRPLWVARSGVMVPSAVDLNHNPEALDFFLNRSNLIPASCVMYRREMQERIGYWDEWRSQGADWDLWVRIMRAGNWENLAYEPIPTCLHFTAPWKPDEWVLLRPDVGGWFAPDPAGPIVPPQLSVSIPEGMAEQQAFWEAISTDPAAWMLKVREGVASALEHAAYRYLCHARERAQFRREVARLKSSGWAIHTETLRLRTKQWVKMLLGLKG